MSVLLVPTGSDFALRAAGVIAERMRSAIRAHGACTLGLSGGSTPGPVYEALAQEMMDWSAVRVFLVDDRCVGPDHPDSNQHLVRSTLLFNLHIPQEQICFPNMSLPPDEAATEYSARLSAFLGDKPADVVVLGMGPDGHIASLFPPLTDSAMGSGVAIHTTTDQFAVQHRISVTLPILSEAGSAVFLLKGQEKIALWEKMIADEEGEFRWPAKAIIARNTATLVHG